MPSSEAGAAAHRPLPRAWTIAGGLVAVLFGLATIRSGGQVLFGAPAARAAAGAYVPFVLWFNFVAGFAYVAAGVGFWLRARWAGLLALVIAAATLLVFAAFALHIALGGAFESRTVAAMGVRSVVWCALAALGWRGLRG
jgi:hypothetical protein